MLRTALLCSALSHTQSDGEFFFSFLFSFLFVFAVAVFVGGFSNVPWAGSLLKPRRVTLALRRRRRRIP